MAKVCTFDGLDLNDKVLYWLMPGFDPGQVEPTYDELVSYAGTVAVGNLQTARLVQLTLPIDVRAASEAAMLAGVEAVNAKIAACSGSSPKTLVVGGRSFEIVCGAQAQPTEDDLYRTHVARLSLSLTRLP